MLWDNGFHKLPTFRNLYKSIILFNVIKKSMHNLIHVLQQVTHYPDNLELTAIVVTTGLIRQFLDEILKILDDILKIKEKINKIIKG